MFPYINVLGCMEAPMTVILENKVYVDGELFCTVELNRTERPEELMDWMVAMIEVWLEDVEAMNKSVIL